MFQSTRRTGATFIHHFKLEICKGLITARTGRDKEIKMEWLENLKFQSTRPHGRDVIVPDLRQYLLFQSTRPHGARRG